MEAQQQIPVELDIAKEKLRKALGRLEDIVERKIKESGGGQAVGEVLKEIQGLKEENSHLREENQKMQANLGSEKKKNQDFEDVREKVTAKIDGLVKELSSVLEN